MRLFYLVLAFCFSCSCWAGDKTQPLVLVQRAAEVSDIRSPGAAPFRMRAKVRTYEKTPDEATYELTWVSPDQWREEITIGPGKAIRIGGHGIVSLKNDSAEAQSVRSRVRLLIIPVTLTLRPEESFGDVKRRKMDGIALQCIRRRGKHVSETELCFDPDKEVLVREDYVGSVSQGSVVIYSGYTAFGPKLFPARIKTYFSNTVKTDVEVISLDQLSPEDVTAFATGSGYITIPGCESPIAPLATVAPDPQYPVNLRKSAPQFVKLSVLVDQSGAAKEPKITESGGALDQSAIDAVSKWKFSPAMCGAQPVPFPVNIEINFRTQ